MRPGGGRWVDRHDDGNGRQTFCRRETKGPRSRVLTEAMKVDIVFVYLCLVCVVSPASPRRVCVCVSWSARDWGGVARKIPSDESGETTAGSTRLVTADSRLDGVEERSRGRVPLLSLRERASGATTRCCVRQRRVKCHSRGIFFICQAGQAASTHVEVFPGFFSAAKMNQKRRVNRRRVESRIAASSI